MRAWGLIVGLIWAMGMGAASYASHAPEGPSLCEQVLISVVESRSLPKVPTRNSLTQLLDSTLAIYQSTTREMAEPSVPTSLMEFLPTGALKLSPQLPATVITVNSGRVVPVHALFVLQANVERALRTSFNLSSQSVRTYGVLIHRAALEAFGLGVREYRELLSAGGLGEELLNAYMPEVLTGAATRDAVDELQWAVHVDRSFDIPFLAGYAAHSPRLVFIDRSIPKKYKLRSKAEFDATPFLVVHEAIEKSLLDFVKLNERSYLRTHQIAQQLEKAAVLAHGISWQEYQYGIMEPIIDKMLRKTPNRVPEDLDLTPYVQEKVYPVLKEMKAAFVKNQRPFTLTGATVDFASIAQVSSPFPGVVHFHFEHQDEMASLFMRFQEYFESPRFSGRVFTRLDFMRWYKNQNNNRFSYFEDWDGFNFPINNLNAFYRGDFTDLTSEERAFLNFLMPLQNSSYYVIATAKNSHPATKFHEFSHALFRTNPEYRQRARQLMSLNDLSAVKQYLASTGGYNSAVLEDETHAWIMNDSADLQAAGIDIAPLQGLISELQSLLFEFYPVAR